MTKNECLIAIIAIMATVLLVVIRAYIETAQVARWYRKQYYGLPRVNRGPEPTRISEVINFILLIPKI